MKSCKLLLLLAGIGLVVCGMCKMRPGDEVAPVPVAGKWSPPDLFWEERTEYEETFYEVEEEAMAMLAAYREFNPDVVGIIRIPGTVLDHPIVHTPLEEEYYLRRDLAGNYNSHGVPFLSADSDLDSTGGNTVIYGHNIRLQQRDVFCDLAFYENIEYYKAHPVVETVSASGTRRWLIFAYFLTDNADADAFRYSDTTRFLSREAFTEYMEEVSKRNWLEVDAAVCFGDTLLTLSSCSVELAGSGTNRMVVMAKLLEKGEDCTSIAERAEMAADPLLPERLR